MHLKLTAAMQTDVGRQREQNEDNAFRRIESLEDGDHGLFVVADGMGGYRAGEVASKLAVDTISSTLDPFFQPIADQPTIRLSVAEPSASADPNDPDATVKLSKAGYDPKATHKLAETSSTTIMEEQFRLAIQQANKAILQYGEKQLSARGLGCTVTGALIQNEQAYIANVGDSRTYLLRDNHLKPVTRDHSLVARLVEAKQIEPEDVYTHPQRNLIYRSLGAGHKNVDVDIFQESLRPGDVLLFCCDGLWEMVRDDDLLKVLSGQESPQQKCKKLIDMANANGGEDNITAIIVQVSASE